MILKSATIALFFVNKKNEIFTFRRKIEAIVLTMVTGVGVADFGIIFVDLRIFGALLEVSFFALGEIIFLL